MDASLKKVLRSLSLELRHILEGEYDQHGKWHPGDLECRLNEIGVWRDRSKPLDELAHLSAEDKAARKVVDAYLKLRDEAGVERQEAVAEFVRESAYTWANRLFALRCMEARNIIEEVILQKDAYGGRSLVHNRFAKKKPAACSGEDDGLFAVLFEEFAERSKELPGLFNPAAPAAPAVALRPSVAALKKCIALLSGRENVKGQDVASDTVFESHDAFGWAYQYWNSEAKDRVFEKVRTKKGAKIEGADIIPATQLYTEPYMVKFLVQNSLGALWMGMHPESKLSEQWEYYVRNADRAPVEKKPVREISMLDPAIGSGHFHLESFDLFYAMYEEEDILKTPEAIAASILNNNLSGIDIDERAIHIATAALWMKAKVKAPKLQPCDLTTFHDHLVATNIRLPKGKDHLEAFLRKHPEDAPLHSALITVFDGLENAHEIGSLLQIEEPVEKALRDQLSRTPKVMKGGVLVSAEQVDFQEWKREVISRLKEHFHAEAQAADLATVFFSQSARQGLAMLDVLGRRYDVVAANPPYMGSKNMGGLLRNYTASHYSAGKRDLFACFILRCLEMTHSRGRIAIVTQQSWMFLRSFADLRASDVKKLSHIRDIDFKGLLRDASFEVLAHLGAGAFEEISGEVVKTVLIVLAKFACEPTHRVLIIAPESRTDPIRKDRELRCRETARFHNQLGFIRDASGSSINYWAPPDLWESVSRKQILSSIAKARKGITTMHNDRFVRWAWESAATDRWKKLAKSLSFVRWLAPDTHRVEWANDGVRVKTFVEEGYGGGGWSRAIANVDMYFAKGCWCSIVCGGNPSFRLLENSIFETKVIAVTSSDSSMREGLLAYLNTGLVTYLLRALSPGLETLPGAVESLPLPDNVAAFLFPNQAGQFHNRSGLSDACLPYGVLLPTSRTLAEDRAKWITSTDVGALGVHCIEAFNENEAYVQMGILPKTREMIESAVGVAASSFPLLAGYEEVPDGVELPAVVLKWIGQHRRLPLAPVELAELKAKLENLYQVGSKLVLDVISDDDANEANGDETEDTGPEITAVHLQRPSETLFEEIARELRIHPFSVYALLKEGIKKEGWRSMPAEQRLIGDRFTIIVLRLLGHRWPKQIEAGEAVPAWADADGVIPITAGTDEKTFLERVRQRIAAEFPGGNVQIIENEFQEIMSETLAKWLPGSFFSRHVSQFKKRPIAWQIESTPIRNHDKKARKKAARTNAGPVFSCLVYYLKLNADLLPKIRTQYVGELITKYQTEQRTLEKLALKTDEQDTRKWQLQNWIDELKAFDDRLNQISSGGFATSSLRQYAIDDAMLQLKARWLEKLMDACKPKQLKSWQKLAEHDKIHDDLPDWIADAITRLLCHCSAVGPEPPDEKKLKDDPTSADLAAIICIQPHKLVREALTLVCEDWWKKFDEIVLAPIKQQIKEARERLAVLEAELEQTDPPLTNLHKLKIAGELKPLKPRIKSLRENMEGLTESADKVRKQIIAWKCDDADDWEKWLAKQPLYDQISALNGEKTAPRTVADWIAQESLYAPDINDGVRVNIAPLQKTELLATDVLASKDLDKAIADRAEWRADERRWVREGKLPQPGWWA
jgi:hypothetical protein